jgi:inner membrane protein involved in colicin E2 resistance
MSLSAVAITVMEKSSDGGVHWVVGGVALLIFVLCLLALVAFGGGREHT